MKIYQLTNTTPYQMMGYVIKTSSGKVIVIDGGNKGQSEELYRVFSMVGLEVELWLLTHIHNDHYTSITELFEAHPEVKVKQLWRNRNDGSLPHMNEGELKEINNWYSFEKETNIPLYESKLNDKITIDNIKIEILGVANPEITKNIINNQSMVIKMTEGDFSVIFLGDLGVEGGEKLLLLQGDKVSCDAVQMAHHGQQGVDKKVYEAIAPTYALWPTPKWLWDNTEYLGGTPGNGPFKTPEVASWMEELGVINITSFDSTIVFDTESKTIEKV